MHACLPNPNHPRKGCSIRVGPIQRQDDVRAIKRMLAGRPRDLALFTLGINSALRASDLLALKVGQVQGLRVGDSFPLKEKKTGKYRDVMLNRASHKAVHDYLKTRGRDVYADDWLFPSRIGGGRLTVQRLNVMVKGWCRAINLEGNYGSHTLRKTFGYHQRVHFGQGTALLMEVFNHASEKQTLDYLGVAREEVRDIHWNTI